MRNLAKGSAALWLRRSPIEFLTSNVEQMEKLDTPQKEVRQVVLKEKLQLESKSINLESKNEPKKVKAS